MTAERQPFSERLPPQNLDAEQAVLGAMILDQDARITARLILTPEDFYADKHGVLFKAITYLQDKRRPVDLQTISDILKRPVQKGGSDNWLTEIGGLLYLTNLMDSVPTTANVSAYAAIVATKAKLRRLANAGRAITEKAHEADDSSDEDATSKAMAESESELRKVTLQGQQGGLKSIGGIVDRAKTKLSAMGQPNPNRLEFGIKELDQFAWMRGEVLSIHAPSGNVKSTIARQIVLNLAKRGKASGFFALETFADQMDDCLIATEGRLSLHRIRNMDREPLNQDEQRRYVEAAERIEAMRSLLYFDHIPMQKFDDVRTKVLQAAMKLGDLSIFVIDYADLLEKVGKERHEQMLIDIHYQGKALAKEVNALCLFLDQAPTEMLRRADPTPTIFDFEYAKGIPKACDGCIGLVVPENCRETQYGKNRVIPAFSMPGHDPIPYNDKRLQNVVIAAVTKSRYARPNYLLPLYHHGPSGFVGNLMQRPWEAPEGSTGREGPTTKQLTWAAEIPPGEMDVEPF